MTDSKQAILAQDVELLELMTRSLATLRRELLPSEPRKFAILSQGPLEEIRRLQLEIEQIAAEIATAASVEAPSK